MVLPILLLTSNAGQVLQPKMHLNEEHLYKVNSVEKDFAGPSDKLSRSIVQGMPIQITAVKIQGGSTSVRVVTGPLVVRGRSVGRSKTNTFDVDSVNSWNGTPYALVGVVFPPGGAKQGQAWVAPFRGSPPLTAGLTATYKLMKTQTQGGQKVAFLSVSVRGDNSCRTRGSGQLIVGEGDGIVRSGKLHFDIAFMRPGKGKTMVVNSHDGLDYTITQ
jgi:hypothetical protein